MQRKTPKRFREAIERARRQVETVIGVLERHSNERDWNLGPEFTKASEDLKALLERNAVPAKYKVAVVGRFKVGKSAFVNELLAQRLAGEDTNPETAAVTTFNYGEPVKATVRFVSKANWVELKKLYESNSADPDAQRVKTWFGLEGKDSKTASAGEQQRFDLKELEQQFVREGGYAIDIVLNAALGKKGEADFRRKVKEFTTGTKPHHCLVETIEIIAPSAILNEGVVIIDTPGVDDTERFRVALTEKAVENVDAILFLTKSGASYSQSEKDFLLSLLRKGTVKQLIFVITQVDQTYDQHVRQSRDQDEDSESIAKRIDREKTRILAEIDASINDLSKDADDASMIRYREQFANTLIEFTSAANHRDAQQGEIVKYPLLDGDPGGINRVQRALFETLSTESRLAATARSIEAGARTILEAQLRILESRRGAIKRLKNREVAEKGLATFRDEFGKAGEEFSKAVAADITFLTAAFTQRDKLAAMAIENISLNAEIVLAEYETNDAGRHWRSRRSGYWGYMRDLQSRVANKIFPAVATMLGGYTDELNGYVAKFKVHLGALSSASTRIADDLDLEAEISFDLEARLEGALTEMLESTQSLIEGEEQQISKLLDEFVTEDVEECISTAREKVSSVWGRGTTGVQTSEVRRFYMEVKSILGEALKGHIEARRKDFVETLSDAASGLPERALSEARAELTLAQDSIRAAAEAALHGRKEAFERLAKEAEESIAATLQEAEKIFADEGTGSTEAIGAPMTSIASFATASPSAAPIAIGTIPSVQIDSESGWDIEASWAKSVKEAATQLVARFVLEDGENKWPWRKVFEARFVEGSEKALIVEPYLSKPHQMRNLREFILQISETGTLKELRIITGSEFQDSVGDDSRLRELAHDLMQENNIDLNWDRDKTNHDRFAIFDTGAVFKLGRGLDIYKPSTGLARNDSALRKVRKCEIDVFGAPGKWESK